MNDNNKNDFIKNGYLKFENLLNKKECKNFLDKTNKIKSYKKSNIFLNENEFLKDPSLTKKNPGRDINNILLDKNLNLDFIFKNEKFSIFSKRF